MLLTVAVAAHAQDCDEIGGDDVLIAASTDFYGHSPSMDIAENGDIYAAVTVTNAGFPEIRVYRSQDAGDSWSLWGTMGMTASTVDFPCVHIGEGTQNRLYLAYRWRTAAGADAQIWVAWASLSAPVAVWSSRLAFSQTGVDFQSPTLHSDEMSNSNYRLYLAAMGSAVDGGDIWFTRSTDFGDTWGSEYQIFSSTTGDGLFYPEIRYGRDGVVHCVCYYNPTATPENDMAVLYRRATNYAALPWNWNSPVDLTSNANGRDEYHASIAASHTNNDVVISYGNREGSTPGPSEFRYSKDGGATWPASSTGQIPDDNYPHLLVLPGTDRFVAWGNPAGTDNFGLNWSKVGEVQTWSVHQSIVDRNYVNVPNTQTGGTYFDYDPTHQDRIGCVWMVYNAAGPDSLFFDAEWRRDPGYPNLESGFPVRLDGLAASPPALCQLDDDAQSEIVCSTTDGWVYVYNHDGTPVPGWPINLGYLERNMAVAVGDISGDGENDVVAGDMDGLVHAFHADGTPLAGWPFDVGTGYSVHVAIGGVTTSQPQVVACSGTTIYLINGDGTAVPPFPRETPDYITAPPALGDVDGDGDREIVVAYWYNVWVFTGTGEVLFWKDLAGYSATDAPTLADLDLNGDLEILVPTMGRLFAVRSGGSDFPGWPFDGPYMEAQTSAALANLTGDSAPEIVFGTLGTTSPAIYALDASGNVLPGFPRYPAPHYSLLGAPTVEVLDEGKPDVIHGGHDGAGYAWTHQGVDLPGWPVDLDGASQVSPASGDLDGDGHVEVVFLTTGTTELVVFDVGADLYREPATPRNWWPMYGYDSRRQGCLACDSVPTDTPDTALLRDGVRFEQPLPNPGCGSVQLRFELPGPAAVRLDVFDVSGRLVRRLAKSELGAGVHDVIWDGRGDDDSALGAGTFFIRLTADAERALDRKIVLLK